MDADSRARFAARTEGLGPKLPMEDVPDNGGRRFASAMVGTTAIPGM